MLPLQALGENPSLLLLVLMLQVFLGLWQNHSNVHLHLYTVFSSVSMSSPLLSLLRRLVIGFRPLWIIQGDLLKSFIYLDLQRPASHIKSHLQF